jgi:hypothetical protein
MLNNDFFNSDWLAEVEHPWAERPAASPAPPPASNASAWPATLSGLLLAMIALLFIAAVATNQL